MPIRIPRHWALASQQLNEPFPDNYTDYDLRAWGWDEISTQAAETMAKTRLERMVEYFRSERYPDKQQNAYYDTIPPREEILEEIFAPDGTPIAYLSRNVYGATVLNADRGLFADIDVPEFFGFRWLHRLIKGHDPDPEGDTLKAIRTGLAEVPHGSFRIYRTAAGFRVVVTGPHELTMPEQANKLLHKLPVDKNYIRLCGRQQCYRARLTPKPWRCGLEKPNIPRHPEIVDEYRDRLLNWLERYEQVSRDYSACRLEETVGTGETTPEMVMLLAIHDRQCKINDGYPLA